MLYILHLVMSMSNSHTCAPNHNNSNNNNKNNLNPTWVSERAYVCAAVCAWLDPKDLQGRRINRQQINYVGCLEVLIFLHGYFQYEHNPRSVRVQLDSNRRAGDSRAAVRVKILNISRTFCALIDICTNTHKSRHGRNEMNSKWAQQEPRPVRRSTAWQKCWFSLESVRDHKQRVGLGSPYFRQSILFYPFFFVAYS